MLEDDKHCEVCKDADFRYTCPRCNIRYCSVDCYKSSDHLKCSEEFYKSCIQEELLVSGAGSKEDLKRIYDILKRIRETDAGAENISFNDPLDSDDDDEPRDREIGSEEEEEELASRLRGVDLNNPEEVWSHLSSSEQLEFQKMVESGDIVKLIPDFQPWWIKVKEPKIVEINSENKEAHKNMKKTPRMAKEIQKFSDICKKPPSPCVHYNLWNLLAAYGCVVRFLSGEHLASPEEAMAHLVNLSATLKYGTNFEDTEDAILSVENEALTTGNGAGTIGLYVESRKQLNEDARQLMSSTNSKLLALSDILEIFQLSKARKKDNLNNRDGKMEDFQKIFAIANASVEMNRSKIKQILKKIEFFLAYVKRDCEEIFK